jgi:hypothetical protein
VLEPWWRKRKLDRDQLKYARLGGEHWRHLEKYLEQLTMGRQYDSNDMGKGPFPGYTSNQLMFQSIGLYHRCSMLSSLSERENVTFVCSIDFTFLVSSTGGI